MALSRNHPTRMSYRKATLLASVGAGLEYYDFVVYSMLASFLEKLFFPAGNHVMSLIQVFGLFAVGYMARPIGGMTFGSLGDRFGRKNTFLASMFLMAFATLAIGILPVHSEVGPLAGMLLVLLRILQGASFGGELPGAVTFVAEHVFRSKRGVHCSFVLSGVGFGAILASSILHLLTRFLSEAQILAWGWRLPFVFGGVLAIVSFLVRKSLQETPLFIQLQQNSKTVSPISHLIRYHSKEVVLGSMITFFNACLIVFCLYSPKYLNSFFGYRFADIYLATTIGLGWSALISPFFGHLSDRMGCKKLMILTSLIFVLSVHFLFGLMRYGNIFSLILFMICLNTVIAALMSSYLALLVQTFPTAVRYTGIAFCYNFAFSMAGLSPALHSYIISLTQRPAHIAYVFIVLALASVGCVVTLSRAKPRTIPLDLAARPLSQTLVKL